jgi:glycosyltransferase involved in cell wall biosynthesis
MKDLTICIPTFNRPDFLKWTLEKAITDFPEAKLLVSDNGRTIINGFTGRYIRQSAQIGAFGNMRAALLAANTKYCIFLGDDDYLLKDEVAKGIEFMEQHPEVLIYYAPCQLYDEVNQRAEWEAFYPAEDETFTRADLLWNFIMQKHVWPEHAIYRRAGLEGIMQPRTAAYWCFVDLANAALRGPVHFAKTPYYRNITQHPVGGRQKLGDQQCLTEFDSYRAGLEVLAYDLFKTHLDKDMKDNANNMIRQFLWSRYEVAGRIFNANGRTAEAELMKKRMEMNGY